MFLLVGLGNPIPEYAGTRHNAGEMLLREVVERYGLTQAGSKFHGKLWKGKLGGHDVLALFPETYMNRSGISVGEAARFYRIPPEHIIVAYDDLDLAPCKFRAKRGGGNGGHNGLRDIDRAIGVDYWRLRLGIGRPVHKAQVTSYVLGRFSADEERDMQGFVRVVAEQLPWLLNGEPEKMMSGVALHNLKSPSEKSAS
jgi:peptidyl-tRNA hydrolase, PTH1 family